MTDFRALCAELAAELDHNRRCLLDDASLTHPLADRARAALAEQEADGPAVPEGREPASVAPKATEPTPPSMQPSDEDLLRIAATEIEPYDRIEIGEYEAGNNCALEVYGSELIAFARAVLARWGSPAQPAPPAEGEVAELVNYLREWGDDYAVRTEFHRAAELLERHAARVPVPVSERLPEPNTKVLAHYFNDHGKGRTICAIWVPAGSRECTGDDSISEPVEGCWPEGWYELIENWNWEDYGYIAVNEGEVAYWQPLPKWPANTLPLPAPEGGEVEP